MVDLIIAISLVMAVLGGWIFVQKLARDYAARHPEFGPAKEEGSGCGKSCLCRNGRCVNRRTNDQPTTNHLYTNTQQGAQHDHS